MDSNSFLSSTQKGFRHRISGCIEHHALLQQALDRLQKSAGGKTEMVMIMTDLSNAFGTVRHSLIDFALRFYHFPPSLISLIAEMYKNLKIRFDINQETDTVDFEIGVFQGDVASPIIFLCVINLFTQLLNSEKYNSTGALILGKTRLTNFAFADDLNLLACSIKQAKTLLDAFRIFIEWSRCLVAALKNSEQLHTRKEKIVLLPSTLN